ncbi:cell division protein FtsZ [Melaminivora sp.]|uniref:cell division protein FtsZ n=1 Tax=Melaminivora sp. TaxID=1933032 RepID=UPI0028B1DBC1|nr:cell division protein FtsZ [Melaminivora sp.]
MSNFQLGLVITGAVVLIIVVAYNAWTHQRNAPRRPRPAEQGERPAEPAARQEPAFDAPPLASAGAVGAPEPAALDHHAVDARDALELPVPQAERPGGLDALIDAIASITAEQAVAGDVAAAALPRTRRVGSKPFAIEALNPSTRQWETPQAGVRYVHLQAGVQLANRVGALNEIEFSEFVMKTQAFADAINGAPDFPDMLHEVARARELDQFASDHDAQLTFMLRARQAAWSPGYIQQNAARAGLVAGAIPGRMVLPAAEAGLPPVLTLAYDAQAAMSDDPEQSALREVLLSLDVAQVQRGEQPFARLRELAQALCQSMDGVLCDQNGTPLPAMAMDPIAADLEQLYDQLDGRELSAGSLLARRLFS